MSKLLSTTGTKTEKILDAVFESAVDGIITINAQGIIETLNQASLRLFGYDRKEELIGQNVNVLMPQPHRKQHDQYLHRYKETGKAQIIGIGREVEGRKKDGSTFSFLLSVSEFVFEDAHFFAGVIHDITDIKAAQEEIKGLNRSLESRVEERTEKLNQVVNQLITTNKQLEREITERRKVEEELVRSRQELEESLSHEKELNVLKSRFVSMASHEFRTPLSTILSSTELLEAYTTTEQQPKRDKHIQRVKSAVNTLNSILDDFLSLSKLEEGKTEVKLETFAVCELIDLTMEELRGLLKKDQDLRLDGLPRPLELYSDPRLLKKILYNLVSNAIKYSPSGKTIRCKVEKDGQHLTISVIDQGIGIPEKDQQHLFTRFFRAHNAENIQGTGLGLNIVKRYTQLLRGNITFESREGKGSTFSIRLPLEL